MGSVPFGVTEATGETRSELTLSLAFSSTDVKIPKPREESRGTNCPVNLRVHTDRDAHPLICMCVCVYICIYTYAIDIHKSWYKVAIFLAAIKYASFKTVYLLLANL
ncbi:uncharacterized protein [Kogia breviceps]|uniref:uncharacterized protein n=1 Tax=Kogia breviceps TaxID=27615 RepID=UPI0034D37F3D